MILDERLRWMGFWMLDKMKGGKTREYYDQIRYAWKEGSSVEETEKRIQNLIAHAVKTTDFYKDYPETCSLEDLPVVNKDTFRQLKSFSSLPVQVHHIFLQAAVPELGLQYI